VQNQLRASVGAIAVVDNVDSYFRADLSARKQSVISVLAGQPKQVRNTETT
jgi:hypothetical protein